MCSGRIFDAMIPSYLGAALPEKAKTTLLPSAVTLVAGAPKVDVQTPGLSSAGYCFMRLKVKATSLAVKGCPSVHLTPWRMSKVSFSPPSQVAFSASHGVSSHVSALRTMSCSYSHVVVNGL